MAQTALLHLEGEGGRPGDVGRGIKIRQVVPHHHCPKSLQPNPAPVTGSPITAEIEPSFSFSPIPCPCRCRPLRFHVKPSWFWKDYSQFLSKPMHMQSYFRKMMLGALWVKADTENAP